MESDKLFYRNITASVGHFSPVDAAATRVIHIIYLNNLESDIYNQMKIPINIGVVI